VLADAAEGAAVKCCDTCRWFECAKNAAQGRCTAPYPEWVEPYVAAVGRHVAAKAAKDGFECDTWQDAAA
jgi:hypothetical protein